MRTPRLAPFSCRRAARGWLIACMAVGIATGVAAPVRAADPDCRPAAEVEQVAPGVYVRPSRDGRMYADDGIASVGFIVGGRCVAVIDSGGSPAEGEALACAIRRVTGLDVCYLIVTHHHPDHALGSLPFTRAGAELVGHVNLARALANSAGFFREQFAAVGRELAGDAVVLPDTTVAVGEPLTLDLGGRELVLSAHPRAHTDNDLSVFDRGSGTLWLSDLLFVGHVPALDGSARGWLQALEALSAEPAERAIPGHGPASVTWPDSADATRRYLTILREEVRELLDDGGLMEDAQVSVGLSERERWRQFDAFHQRNVIRVFREMEWED